jgi:hypothetical protein
MLPMRMLIWAMVLLSSGWLTPAYAQEDEVVVFSMSREDMAGVENGTEELKELAHGADAECRQYPNDARTFAGCAARNVYLDILEERDVCNTGPFLWEENWIACSKEAEQ